MSSSGVRCGNPSRDFEAIAVVAHYGDDEAAQPDVIGLTVSTWRGPQDDAPETVQFREHVTRLRDRGCARWGIASAGG
jgi:hypothetical protein